MTVEDLKLAREKLKANDPSSGLPGREDKISELEDFLFERLKIRQTAAEKKARIEAGVVANIKDRHNNKTVFVCGVPGTGKTAVVMSVVDKLHQKSSKKNCPLAKFEYYYINAQHLSKPQKIYSEIMYQITKISCSSERAQECLDRIFTADDPEKAVKISRKQKEATKSKITKNSRFVIIIDELDLLYNEKRQSVFYSLFDWPTSHASRMILITIANAMDLPERHMRGRIASRLGWNKIVFEPYTSDHLESILKAKLGLALLNKCFDKNAIIVATKRIGKTTGDARRIIDTCCLAVDEAIREKSPKVTSAIVDRVGFQNLDRMKTDYIKSCPPLELMILHAILLESASQGEENIIGGRVYEQVCQLLKCHPHPWLRDHILAYDQFYELLNTLQAVGLIALDDQGTLMEKRMFIKDTSDTFRDVIRTTKVEL